ncbi:hypothetical protein GUY61_38510, partial [Streptomyces sp. GC420]|nr:hypothetical protein [Streptomyces sp. GC420]
MLSATPVVRCRRPQRGAMAMKAIVQDAYGSEDLLDLRDIDRPVQGDDEVLVEVRAAGVGPEVWHLMTGKPYVARVALGLGRPKNPVRGWDGVLG